MPAAACVRAGDRSHGIRARTRTAVSRRRCCAAVDRRGGPDAPAQRGTHAGDAGMVRRESTARVPPPARRGCHLHRDRPAAQCQPAVKGGVVTSARSARAASRPPAPWGDAHTTRRVLVARRPPRARPVALTANSVGRAAAHRSDACRALGAAWAGWTLAAVRLP